MPGTAIMGQLANGNFKNLVCADDGQLKVDMSATIDTDGLGISAYQDITSDSATRIHCDNTGAIHTHENKLPASLTGSGNLKVCIQELGNEGSERLNVDVGTITQLPTALTGEGNLKVSIQEDHSHLLSTSALQTSGNATLTSLDGKITKGKDATAVDAELQQVLIYGKKDDGTLQPLECLGDRLLVDVVELSASGKITTSTALSSVQVCGYDTGTSQFKTLNVDSSGNLQTEDQKITTGDSATLTTAQQNLVYGRSGASALQALAVDTDGHLQVDILSGGGGGDATSANQTTAIGHLSEIEGAVETLEACVSGNKVAVELSAGDINIGNVDVVSASGITQLPSTLGQKANSNSLSICRSNTAGAFDLSARTTIGTASTTTKLACDTAGHLFVKTAQNTSNGGGTNTATIAVGALGHAQSLSADNTFANVFLMVDTADSGAVEDIMVMVARQNTATSDYFVHTKIIPSGGTGGPTDVEWVALTGTTRYYAHVHIRKPPEYIAIYNAGFNPNKIAVLYNYGLE